LSTPLALISHSDKGDLEARLFTSHFPQTSRPSLFPNPFITPRSLDPLLGEEGRGGQMWDERIE